MPSASAIDGWHTAVCIVGAPRAFAASCVHDALRHNLLQQLPGSVTVFAHFSRQSGGDAAIARAGALNSIGMKTNSLPLSTDAELVAAAEAVHAACVHIQPANVTDTDLVAECVRAHMTQADYYGGTVVQWQNVHSCYRLVQAHEAHAHRQFDFILRVRPDAIFFTPFRQLVELHKGDTRHHHPTNINGTLAEEMASAIVSNHALLPLGGLGGPCYRACANDHMAIVPRAAADRYFEGVSRLLSHCGSGPKFFAELTRRGNLRSPRGMAMGAEARFGPGYIFTRVGLRTRSVPWPYAFGVRACGESVGGFGGGAARGAARGAEGTTGGHGSGTGGDEGAGGLRLTPPRIEECVLPLQCERVEWLTREGMGFHFDGGPWEETLRRYVATCRAWTCAEVG